MALNFGEVFLRESGAAQDRAQSMTEMQLRAKQFADDLAYREAQLQFSKEVQSFNEEEARFQREQKFLDRAQQNEQFKQKIQLEKDALNQQKDISDADRAAEMKRLDAQVSQWEAQNNIAWANLDQDGKQMMLDYGIKVEDLGIRKDLAKAEIEETKARTAAITGAEERAQDMAPLEQMLTGRQIQAGAIANALSSLQLARETRGEAYLTEQASEETKKLLGLNPEDNLTNERAGNLLQVKMLEEGLRQKELTGDLYEAKAKTLQQPITNMELVPNYATSDEQLNFIERQYYKNVIPFATSFLTGSGFSIPQALAMRTLSQGKTYASLAGKYGVSPEGIKRIYGKTPLELAGPEAQEIYNIATELGKYETTSRSLLDNIGTELGVQGIPVPFYFQNNILQNMSPQQGVISEE